MSNVKFTPGKPGVVRKLTVEDLDSLGISYASDLVWDESNYFLVTVTPAIAKKLAETMPDEFEAISGKEKK